MPAAVATQLSPFALDVAEGLGSAAGKWISSVYFYDDLGSALFEAITQLPEYGVTRADERTLERLSPELVKVTGSLSLVAELGSGSGKKTRRILEAAVQRQGRLTYCPIDVSAAALAHCRRELDDVAEVVPLQLTWTEGVSAALAQRKSDDPVLLLFLGSSIGNLPRLEMPGFFSALRNQMRPGDYFLLGADLVKATEVMLAAYDDPTGVTAAFNLNLLARVNRELGAEFDLRLFRHEARWSEAERRIEMHLVSLEHQQVRVAALGRTYSFQAGESIWTESSHKFTSEELERFASAAGFVPLRAWIDDQWPFAEVLWRAQG